MLAKALACSVAKHDWERAWILPAFNRLARQFRQTLRAVHNVICRFSCCCHAVIWKAFPNRVGICSSDTNHIHANSSHARRRSGPQPPHCHLPTQEENTGLLIVAGRRTRQSSHKLRSTFLCCFNYPRHWISSCYQSRGVCSAVKPKSHRFLTWRLM